MLNAAPSQDGRTPVLQPPYMLQPHCRRDRVGSAACMLQQEMALDADEAIDESSLHYHVTHIHNVIDKLVNAHRRRMDDFKTFFELEQQKHDQQVATLTSDIQVLTQAEQKQRLVREDAEKKNNTYRQPEAGIDIRCRGVPLRWRFASDRLTAWDVAIQRESSPINIFEETSYINKVIVIRLAAQAGDGDAQNPAMAMAMAQSDLDETQDMTISTDEEDGTTNHSAFDASTLDTGVLISSTERTHRSRSPRLVG